MKSLDGLTQEQLKKLVIYNPITGNFISKVDRGKIKVGAILGTNSLKTYVYIKIDKTKYSAHRLAFLYMEGRIPKVVDHVDGNPSNNSWDNLREATQTQNTWNAVISERNTSEVKGLSYNAKLNHYRGDIKKDGKTYTKAYACKAWGKDKARELTINWLRVTRKHLHGEFTNHG